jgi:phosphatidylinositol-bisphosphatase
MPKYLQVNISFRFILGETITISVTILMESIYCSNLNCGITKLYDIFIIKTERGRDLFVEIDGKWDSSCFGLDLSTVLKLLKPVRSYSTENFNALKTLPIIFKDYNSIDILSQNPLQPKVLETNTLTIPKEIWRLADFIYKYGMVICYDNCRMLRICFLLKGMN